MLVDIEDQFTEWWWWPSQYLWLRAGQNAGWWTPWNEAWWYKRREDILHEKDGPRRAIQWKRGTQPGWKDDAARVMRRLRTASMAFLDEYYIRA